jgi:6-phosphogluconate dehydrogenase
MVSDPDVLLESEVMSCNWVSDSGEGRWTIKAAIDEAVPVPVLSAALYQRFSSRGEAGYQDKLLSAMRYGFGGHLEKAVAK